MKIKLIHESSLETITIETKHVYISSVLESIDKFLKAAGYCYEGSLGIVDEGPE